MIKKKFRLKEKDVKRVLQKWEPFFSYNIVLNKQKNKLLYNRFSIVISAKSVNCNVDRNFFRRRFFDFIQENEISKKWFDFVFVVKNKTKLDSKNKLNFELFKKDLRFLISKIW